ncbi:MAG: hypothetical protein LBR39_03800 [Coriobacteriales bacterium]|nr:hypothetical protein [Coriobacteriales bacterium]
MEQNQRSSKPTSRFSDPLGEHVQLLSEQQQRQLAQYPPVEQVYCGFYGSFDPRDKTGGSFLIGTEGIIGADIGLELRDGQPWLTAPADGRPIAIPDEPAATRLRELLQQDWEIRCILARTIYRTDDKGFTGEFAALAIQAGNSEAAGQNVAAGVSAAAGQSSADRSVTAEVDVTAALHRFGQHIAERLRAGERPSLALTQLQLARVLDSNGEWYLTKAEPKPSLPEGAYVYRGRRSWSESLISQAYQHNKGCGILSWVVIIAIAALAAWAIWQLLT